MIMSGISLEIQDMLFAGSSRADIVEILQIPMDWILAEEKQNELDYAAARSAFSAAPPRFGR